MGWVFLILAGICEMVGVAMINKLHKDRNLKAFSLMFIGFGFSFFFLSLAMKTLPMGLSYAVWTGIGACGGAIVTAGLFFPNLAGIKIPTCVGIKFPSAAPGSSTWCMQDVRIGGLLHATRTSVRTGRTIWKGEY